MTNGHSSDTVTALNVVGPAQELYVAGMALFEITDFTPPVQRVTVVGVNLPDPDTFGPYDMYVATLSTTGGTNPDIASMILEPTASGQVWAGTTELDFGGTLPTIDARVEPQGPGGRIGPVILEGTIFGATPSP